MSSPRSTLEPEQIVQVQTKQPTEIKEEIVDHDYSEDERRALDPQGNLIPKDTSTDNQNEPSKWQKGIQATFNFAREVIEGEAPNIFMGAMVFHALTTDPDEFVAEGRMFGL